MTAALALVACEQRQAGQGLALKEGLEAAEQAGRLPPLTAAAVDERSELLAVLARPFARAAPRLGGWSQTLSTRFVVEADGEREVTLDETVTLRVDAQGRYALRHENTYGSREDHDGADGRACWWVDGRFYTARRHGPATEVPVRAYEQERCLESGVEPFVGLLRLLGRHLAPTPQGEVDVVGRRALRVALTRDGAGVEVPEPLPLAWPVGDAGAVESPAVYATGGGARGPLVDRYTRPIELQGEVLLDVETGAVLAGEIEGTLALRKADRDATLKLRATLAAAPLEGEIAPPEKARPYAPRQRVFEERRALLGETFKKREQVELPKPGDAPPLRLGPSEEVAAPPAEPAADPEDEPR